MGEISFKFFQLFKFDSSYWVYFLEIFSRIFIKLIHKWAEFFPKENQKWIGKYFFFLQFLEMIDIYFPSRSIRALQSLDR